MNSWQSHKSISSKEKERRLTFIMVHGIGLTRKETINKEWTSKDRTKKERHGYKRKNRTQQNVKENVNLKDKKIVKQLKKWK